MVNNLPAMQEAWVWYLGQVDPLKKGMATHSGILAWENPMDRGVWQATVHGVTKSQTQRTILLSFPLCTVGEIIHCYNHYSWRRKWQSTPVLLPGKSHGQRSLVGYSPWGCQESDMTEQLHSLTIIIENSMEVSQKIKNRASIWSRQSFWVYIWKKWNHCLEDMCVC